MQDMRVALIAFESLTVYAIQLANALCKITDLHFFVSDSAANRYKDLIDPDINLHPFRTFRLRNPIGVYVSIKLLRQIKRTQCRIAHLVLSEPWLNLCIPFVRSFPLVTTIHDVRYHLGDRRSNIVPQAFTDLAARYSSASIVHGVALKEQLCHKFRTNPELVFVIPIMNFSLYRHWEKPGIKEEANTILFFGSIWEYKGLKYLMQAESHLAKELNDFKIVIAGKGEDIDKYRKYIIDPHNYEIINKYIPNAQVAELFQKASIVVLPYVEASQSGVIPLAFSFGKPVVATKVGSIPEMVDHGKNGLLVAPRNPRELAAAIIKILSHHNLRKSMSQEAEIKAYRELSSEKIAKMHVKAYMEIYDRFRKNWGG
jgi:glycosyltransferase involved in cell wall biosynthesis